MSTFGQWVVSGVAGSVACVVLVVLHLATRHLEIGPKQRRRVRRVSQYAIVLALLVVMVVVWAEQLRVGAFVLSAFAVAIVLATKETLLCFQGWWLKIAGGHYRIGDRVQIGQWKGDVVDYGLLTTTLLEVSTGANQEFRSGGTVTIPNSLLLSEPVRNETRSLPYTWHTVTIHVPAGEDWRVRERLLLDCARQEWTQYAERAREEVDRLEDDIAQPAGGDEPQVFVSQSADGLVELRLRIGVPVGETASADDRIVRAYLDRLSASSP
jgi:small-conductance mechanosensitive channel